MLLLDPTAADTLVLGLDGVDWLVLAPDAIIAAGISEAFGYLFPQATEIGTAVIGAVSGELGYSVLSTGAWLAAAITAEVFVATTETCGSHLPGGISHGESP